MPSFAFGEDYKEQYRRIFDKADNMIARASGMVILIHQVWAATVEVDNVQYFGHRGFEADFRFSLYDDFGLDRNDLRLHNSDGFIAWYILQHYHTSHKPFITKIAIEERLRISGGF